MPEWAQKRIAQLTIDYNNAGDVRNEFGDLIRNDIHAEAFNLRMQFLDPVYLNYAILDFKTFGITESNYLDMLGIWDEDVTYSQALHTYAMELQNNPDVTEHMLRNSDGTLKEDWVKSVAALSGTPGNNQVQNRQAREAARKYNLSKEGQRLLHDTITGRGYGPQEILEEAKAISELGGKYVK